MRKCVDRLRKFQNLSFQDYLDEFDNQLLVERLIELLVEFASDINSYLLVELYQTPPDTYATSFSEASKQGLISSPLAQKLSKSAGMRNILVHQYLEVEHEVVYSAIPKAITQYQQYIKEITLFLDNLEEN
jgi:uncharacterized protein YutE (UPF0331/DUF86 family)